MNLRYTDRCQNCASFTFLGGSRSQGTCAVSGSRTDAYGICLSHTRKVKVREPNCATCGDTKRVLSFDGKRMVACNHCADPDKETLPLFDLDEFTKTPRVPYD